MIQLNVQKMNLNVKAIQNASSALRNLLVGEETMTDLALQAGTIVQNRTQEGRDADGSYFDPYTDDYAKKRAKAGRSLKPDLTWSGKMLRNIHALFLGTGKSAVVFRDSTMANIAAGNSKKRNFFSLTATDEVNALVNQLDRKIGQGLKRLGL